MLQSWGCWRDARFEPHMDDKKQTVVVLNTHLCCVWNLWTQRAFTSVSEPHITAISISHQWPHLISTISAVYHSGHACATRHLGLWQPGSGRPRGSSLRHFCPSPKSGGSTYAAKTAALGASQSQLLPAAAGRTISHPQGWEVRAMAQSCKLGPLK